MAFSMFFRTPACTSRIFGQQMLRLATQATLANRPVATMLPAKILALQEVKHTPILNSVRSFTTTRPLLSGDKPHDHSKLWVIEKAVSALMIPLIPVALLLPNKLFDSILAILISAHAFWGLEAIAVDYVRATIFGPFIPKVALGLVYLLTIATLGGLFYIISHDDGLSNTIRQFWAIKSNSQKS